MRKLLVMVVMQAGIGTAQAQIPTTDIAHIAADEAGLLATLAEWGKEAASWAKQASDMANQAKSWIKQSEDMKQQYDAITGIRNLGDVFNNRILRRNVPDDWNSVYDTAGDAMLLGDQAQRVADMRTISAKVRASEQLVDTMGNDMARIGKRASDMAANNKAVGQSAYSKQPGLMKQIEALMSKINETQDAKAIAELQARIDAEAAAQTWQTNNLTLIAQMERAESDLANRQRIDLSMRVLGSTSTEIPSLLGVEYP